MGNNVSLSGGAIWSDDKLLYDLMPFKIRDILLISSMYDAYILENERILSEQIFGEYHRLNLSSAPKITHASSLKTALSLLKRKSFDMAIVMRRLGDSSIYDIGEKIKEIDKKCCVMLLLNNNSELALLHGKMDKLEGIDNVFVWNGDSKVFLAMVKHMEDRVNAVSDTGISLVRIILLVEDSIRHYSRFLPVLYTQIIRQTQRLIAEENLDEMVKVLRMRARPKVLLGRSYEEAVKIIDAYRDYLLCLISDISFTRNGKEDESAGFKLISHLKGLDRNIPVLLQSSNPENRAVAMKLDSAFICKDSQHLERELADFMINNLGFGDFVFKNSLGKELARARTMADFKRIIRAVDIDSVLYHAGRNHFSAWLLARGEIHYAKILQPVKIWDFQKPEELRQYIIDIFEKAELQKTRGRIIRFDESVVDSHSHIIVLGEGSLGGKGRGLAFINSVLQKIESKKLFDRIDIKIPVTYILGTQEFESFIDSVGSSEDIFVSSDFEKLKTDFLNTSLSSEVCQKVNSLLSIINQPVAVRSSGLFEDSFSFPFAGIYDTYLLPNNVSGLEKRKTMVCDAIKLIYASVFSSSAKSYFEAINYKIHEEKMAVIIQKVAGRRYQNAFYPHISGIAQSYNYYPVSYLGMDDGIAIIAVGLGKYVVEGEKAFRFCPKYPDLDILGMDELVKDNQKEFYSLDMTAENVNLIEGEACTLKRIKIQNIQEKFIHDCVSVYDYQNNRIETAYKKEGPRIVNFANILKYNKIPLSRTIEILMDIIKDAMGTAVEMEFAVDLGDAQQKINPSFYILQVKPLLSNNEELRQTILSENREDIFIISDKSMGNGIIEDISDILFIDLEKFDRRNTEKIAKELERLNSFLIKEGRKYILIGPGRWGTRDKWLGIPVTWANISNAKVIVEISLKNFQVEASLGSHFFQNIISLNIGYCSVPCNSSSSYVDYSWLGKLIPFRRHKYLKHYRFKDPLKIIMDGRRQYCAVYKGKRG